MLISGVWDDRGDDCGCDRCDCVCVSGGVGPCLCLTELACRGGSRWGRLKLCWVWLIGDGGWLIGDGGGALGWSRE